MKPDSPRSNWTSPKRPLSPEDDFPSLRRDYSRPTTAVPIRRPSSSPYGKGNGRRARYSHFQPMDRIQGPNPRETSLSPASSHNILSDNSSRLAMNGTTSPEAVSQDAEACTAESTKSKSKVSNNLNDRMDSAFSADSCQVRSVPDSASDHVQASQDHQLRRSARVMGKSDNSVSILDDSTTTAVSPSLISIDVEEYRELRESIRERFDSPLNCTFLGHKSMQINADDAERLIEGEYLNDTLVDFGLKFILDCQRQLNPEAAKRTFVFNTFFYSRLTQRSGKAAGESGKSVYGYESVRNWTSKVDIFTMRYVIVPIHEKSHWYVAVICNLDKLPYIARDRSEYLDEGITVTEDNNENSSSSSLAVDNSQLEENEAINNGDNLEVSPAMETKEMESKEQTLPNKRHINLDDPVILILDSLNLQHNYVFKPLREYLISEARTKRHLIIRKDDIKSRHGTVPLQDNYCDCGIFLIHYVEKFLNSPETVLPRLLDKEPRRKTPEYEEEQNELWGITEVRDKRRHMLNLLMKLKSDKENPTKRSPSV